MKITLALLSLAIAAVPTSASAETAQQLWDACCKTHYAKTNPNVPIAPPQPKATPVQSMTPLTWTDECVLVAVAQLPLPVAPGALRRVRDYCAAQSIWREKAQ